MIKSFYVKVIKPAAIYEYNIEVHQDLIGLDDENQTNNSLKCEANRIALQKAKRGEDEQTDRMNEEMIALSWGDDEVEMMSVFALDEGKKDIAELRELLTKHAPKATPVFQKLKEMENESRQWSTSQSGDNRGCGSDSGKASCRNITINSEKSGKIDRDENTRQRTPTRNRSSRGVAKVQRKRNSRAG